MEHSGTRVCVFTHNEDAAIAQFIEKGPATLPEPSRMSESQIAEVRLQLTAFAGAGIPDIDYSGIEFMDAVEKSWGSKKAPKAPKQPRSKQEPVDLVGRQASFAVKPPRLVPRFPWVSNVKSKITAMKKKYRMKKLLARRPHLAKPAAGGAQRVTSSRPQPVKTTMPTLKMQGMATRPVKASAVAHFPKPPAPVKAGRGSRHGMGIKKSLATLPNGTVIELINIQ